MCELLTLRPPYSEFMKGDGDKKEGKAMPWDQVVALTHKEDVMLRPTLPDDMDAATADTRRAAVWQLHFCVVGGGQG